MTWDLLQYRYGIGSVGSVVSIVRSHALGCTTNSRVVGIVRVLTVGGCRGSVIAVVVRKSAQEQEQWLTHSLEPIPHCKSDHVIVIIVGKSGSNSRNGLIECRLPAGVLAWR